eukprot:1157380-Pelagomonas_calceolata.AAC.2
MLMASCHHHLNCISDPCVRWTIRRSHQVHTTRADTHTHARMHTHTHTPDSLLQREFLTQQERALVPHLFQLLQACQASHLSLGFFFLHYRHRVAKCACTHASTPAPPTRDASMAGFAMLHPFHCK